MNVVWTSSGSNSESSEKRIDARRRRNARSSTPKDDAEEEDDDDEDFSGNSSSLFQVFPSTESFAVTEGRWQTSGKLASDFSSFTELWIGCFESGC